MLPARLLAYRLEMEVCFLGKTVAIVGREKVDGEYKV